MNLKYGIYRKENFDVRERGTYNAFHYSIYGIAPHILAEREKVGTDPRNMQCLEAQTLYFGDKSEVNDFDIVEFVDGEIHTIDLPIELIKKGKKVVCRIWTAPEYKKVWTAYGDEISYLFSWSMPIEERPKSYAVIPPAVEPDFFTFKHPREKPEPLKIGYLGILVYWKGHQFIERIVADLADNGKHDVELHMYGRKDEEPLQHKAIKYHGLIEKREDVPKAFKEFDVYCCPWNPKTEPDSFWVVCMEALATGLPIVTFRCGSAREFIDEGINGFTATSVEDMSQKLMNYYLRPDLIQQHALNSRVKMYQKFSPALVTSQMARFLYGIK